MRKKIIKVLVILTVMCLIIMGLSCKSFGDYVSNLRDQQANLQSQLEASNIQVEIIQSDISELAAQILQMNEDITSQEIEVDLLRSQSKELQESIEKNEVELEEITETYNKQKKILEARLVASYICYRLVHYLNLFQHIIIFLKWLRLIVSYWLRQINKKKN